MVWEEASQHAAVHEQVCRCVGGRGANSVDVRSSQPHFKSAPPLLLCRCPCTCSCAESRTVLGVLWMPLVLDQRRTHWRLHTLHSGGPGASWEDSRVGGKGRQACREVPRTCGRRYKGICSRRSPQLRPCLGIPSRLYALCLAGGHKANKGAACSVFKLGVPVLHW
ncbi:unnamed protein product [Ixodes pacificus]